MTRSTKVFGVALAVVAGLGLLTVALRFGLGRSDTVQVGSILVLSGNYKSQGEQIRDGQTIAMDEINAQSKTKLNILFRDSEGEKETSLRNVKELQSQGVKFISEIFGSTEALHCLPFIRQQNMLFISGVDTGASLSTAGGKNFFRIMPSDRLASQQLAAIAMAHGYKKAAIVFANDVWGEGLKDEMEAEYKRLGGETTLIIDTVENQDLFQPVVARLKADSPPVTFLFLYARDAGNFVKEARRQGIQTEFMGTDDLTGTEFADVGGDAVEGVTYVVPGPLASSDRRLHFQQLYKAKFGPSSEPPLFATQGYDTIHILWEAIEASGGDVQRATSYLEQIHYDGASGPIAFDSNHELVVSEYRLKVFHRKGGQTNVEDLGPTGR